MGKRLYVARVAAEERPGETNRDRQKERLKVVFASCMWQKVM